MSDQEVLIKKAQALRSKIGENMHDKYAESLFGNAAAIASRTISKDRKSVAW